MSDILQKDFQIERIVKAGTREGKRMYFVKWKDYPDSENTWECADDLRHDGYGDKIDAYEKRRSKAKKKAPSKKKAPMSKTRKQQRRRRLTPPPRKPRKGNNSSLGKAVTATFGVLGNVLQGAGNLIRTVVGSNETQQPPPSPAPKTNSDDELSRRIDSRRKKKIKF